ncbi:MAG TPA: S8 family peptidase [Armatimonadota bacterium]|jgi:hypothetical protein
MKIERLWIEQLLYAHEGTRRFIHDSPILPDVWLNYGNPDNAIQELLITPYGEIRPGELAQTVLSVIRQAQVPLFSCRSFTPPDAAISYNRTTVVLKLPIEYLATCVLPMSKWWEEYLGGGGEDSAFATVSRRLEALARDESLPDTMTKPQALAAKIVDIRDVFWLAILLGTLIRGMAYQTDTDDLGTREQVWREILRTPRETLQMACDWLRTIREQHPALGQARVFSVHCNRQWELALWSSCRTIKADAATRVFSTNCREITWAIIDSGIDATHPAFRTRELVGQQFDDINAHPAFPADGANHTRIKKTYDFTRLRAIVNLANTQSTDAAYQAYREQHGDQVDQIIHAMQKGREIDWALLEPLLEVPHTADAYLPPIHEHGTHVAGILAGDWPERCSADGQPFHGICPDIQLLDLRVVKADGSGDEFTVIAALQYLRWLNAHKDFALVHGVNLSLSFPHDVANYACGRTPVCEESERLVGSGIVVVAAAGNLGFQQYMTATGLEDGYRSISITDPGNAQNVITVGSTHRQAPHSYGVSYFSSRGPTGDGRQKPDIVAPGEKIESSVPGGGLKRLDGTSMAAPHVSGAAALLIARHRELAGNPQRIKQVLCDTATDLGRERYFQGCGMVDILRAIQSV